MTRERATGSSARPLNPEFEQLLEFLRDNRGFDFTGYKRASLERRIGRRMRDVGVASYADYLDHLQFHPEEFSALFNTILINVTAFFRDPPAWDHLREHVLPGLLGTTDPSRPIRVWSAGTASGAEAYSVAILLAEALGVTEFRDRVKIYATDVDEDALAEARQGTFTDRQMGGVSEQQRSRWFERSARGFVVAKDLRRCVIFGRNDLVQDAPISRVDLLVCRNTLMYFTAETQDRVLRRFHFALSDHGVLFLGKAETLLTQSRLFVPIDARHRLFRRMPGSTDAGFGRPSGQARWPGDPGGAAPLELALNASQHALLIVDRDGELAWMNQRAVALFALPESALGRTFRELDPSVRPVDLRPVLERATREARRVVIDDVEWPGDDDPTYWDVTVAPLIPETGVEQEGWAITFMDVTGTHRLQSELSIANKQLEQSYEELQSTVEELETTNEELQSTVEELETTNEELQSTNEELETTNEELQSTNDELHSANEELSERGAQIAAANTFMNSILTALESAVIVVDREFAVTAWSTPAEEMWGLRAEEVLGQHLMNLDMGLPLDRLYPLARAVLATGTQAELSIDAVNRRGRHIVVSARVAPLVDPDGATTGAIVFVTEQGAASSR